MRRALPSIIIRVLGFLLIATLIFRWLPKIDFTELRASFLSARIMPLVFSAIAVLLFWLIRGTVLWQVLRLKAAISWPFVTQVSFIGAMMDQFIPFRGGYLVRWGLLSTRLTTQKSYVISALAACFMLEGLILTLLFLILLGLDKSAEAFSSGQVTLALIVAFTLVVGALLFSSKLEKLFSKTFVRKLPPIMALFQIASDAKKSGRLFFWILMGICEWLLQMIAFHQVAAAFSYSLSISEILILLMSVNLAIVIPVMPANLGTLQIVITWVLVKLGCPQSTALAISIIYHAVQVLPILVAGALCSLSFPWKKFSLKGLQKSNA